MSLKNAQVCEQTKAEQLLTDFKLHLSDASINKNICMVYIFNRVKIHQIIIFWLKFYTTDTCDTAFSLRLEAA